MLRAPCDGAALRMRWRTAAKNMASSAAQVSLDKDKISASSVPDKDKISASNVPDKDKIFLSPHISVWADLTDVGRLCGSCKFRRSSQS